MNITVRELLIAEGFGPRMTFGGFDAAVYLADCVSRTIGSHIKRAQFVAAAAAALAELDYQPFEGLEDVALRLAERAEAERPTPLGAVELWGSLLQRLEPA